MSRRSSKKRRAFVRDDPSGIVRASQSYDSVMDGCLKIGKVEARYLVSPFRGPETRVEFTILKKKEEKYFADSFLMNLRREHAERLALGIAPWLRKAS